MTNYDGRPPNLRPRTGWGGAWRRGDHVANAPATNSASTAHTGPAAKSPAKTP